MLCQHAAREDADAEAQVPSGEIGGSGCATLGVGSQIDEQRIKRRKGRAKSQATAQGNQQESPCRVLCSQCIAMVTHTQSEHGQHYDA